MTTKIVDSKGRITLSTSLAGRTVIVDDSNPAKIVITPAVVIPEHEAWLYKNPKALKAVREGLEQLKQGKYSKKKFDLAAAQRLADQMED